MIVCIRTVDVPVAKRARFLEWIGANRQIREQRGILFELVLETDAAGGQYTVITGWPSHQVFDAWIATPERNQLTTSEVHASVEFRPITRHNMVGGYVNQNGLTEEFRE